MGAFTKTVIAVLALAVIGWAGMIDYESALILEAIEKEARPARAIAIDRSLPFAIPLDFQAAVCQRQYYGERPTCRYYVQVQRHE